MIINKYKLKDIAKIDISSVDKKSKENEQSIKLCNFMDVYNNWAITNKMYNNFMSATANKNEIERYILKKGMIAITKDSETRDDIGMSTYIADSFDNVILGYHTALIIPNNNIVNSKYLNAYLNSKLARNYFSNSASGSGQRYTLTIDIIGNLPVFLPNMQEQSKIGNILSYSDRVIENNTHINNNLEELMKTIYQRWFIEFEFPNEEGKPYKSSGGKFVYNNELKQEIPEGWKVKKLSDVNNIFLGGTPNTKNSLYWNGNIKWMNSGEVSNFPVVDTELKITKMGLENSATKYMKKGTIVVSITGNIRTSILAENMCANQSVVGIEENSLLKKSYLYPIMKNMTDYYINISSGNCQKHINKKTLEETLIPIPTSNVLNNYYGLAEPYCNLIINNGITNKKLANQKNFLLPLLMNGQINVDDIEI